MEEKAKLLTLCAKYLSEKGLNESEPHKKRLAAELDEIGNQNEWGYFVDLYENEVKYDNNDNNLLIPYLLGIVDDFDIEKEPKFYYGDWPDADLDFFKEVRDYLKDDWAKKEFGERNVCSIGSYNTFGIKSALIDMARVFSLDRNEILSLTKPLEAKDDEGDIMTWDMAMELYPKLKEWCERNEDAASAAKVLLGRRRSMGKHAGGLIISSVPLDEFVPLCVDKDGIPVSSWTEGQHSQDLQEVGCVKCDLLVSKDNERCARIVELVKKKHNLASINALPESNDWSDTDYLDDPLAIAMANRGDLKCIFQFDASAPRRMCREGGVTGFHDLMAYTSLNRPGALGLAGDKIYCQRKRGAEDYELHPILESITKGTYGILLYQEQIAQLLNKVGDVPLKDCEIVRKAISKKKIEKFLPFKNQFINNGIRKLGMSQEYVHSLWEQVENWSGYGFNKCHACVYTVISARLLWLKVYFPIEFYATTLTIEDTLYKVKEYMNDARAHDVQIEKVDVNISQADFVIHENKIYYGLAKIKGIGIEVAKRIAAHAPYASFQDFLERFGTDSRVVLPLIALGAFKEDKLQIYKYYEFYKERKKKLGARGHRFDSRMTEIRNAYKELVGIDDLDELFGVPRELPAYADDMFNLRLENSEHSREKFPAIKELWKKWRFSVSRYYKFEPDDTPFDSESDKLLNRDFLKLIDNCELAETTYYGFVWQHPLEKCKNFEGYTFEKYNQEVIDNYASAPVEVVVKECKSKISRNDKVYYSLKVEDADSTVAYINIWSDDYQRWKSEFVRGKFLRLSLSPPSGGYSTYTLARAPKRDRFSYAGKENDFRVFTLE